ncbi:hypothetical protein M885DRAFT_621983 [Pelagophyceae sp. CCMP2097]|nr:hypothetical protein M885DRAFT_621983 [Pelagophyceae sp. CCMP2097]
MPELDNEALTLCGLCESVPRRLRQLVANRQIKTHMVEFEVPRFVRCWRTLGLFCEDTFESIHALMNRMKMRFALGRVVRGRIVLRAKHAGAANTVPHRQMRDAMAQRISTRRRGRAEWLLKAGDFEDQHTRHGQDAVIAKVETCNRHLDETT